MRHSLTTRILHLLVAAAIVIQLANSQLMRVPHPGREISPIGAAGYWLHEYVGLASMVVIGLFWLWLPLRRGETSLALLFPWFSAARRADFFADIVAHLRAAMRLTLPHPEETGALSAAIQGGGLVAVLYMAVSGTVAYFVWTPGTAMTGGVHLLLESHALMSKLVWGYIIVHVGAAVLHELLGQRILYRMSLRPGAVPAPSAKPGG